MDAKSERTFGAGSGGGGPPVTGTSVGAGCVSAPLFGRGEFNGFIGVGFFNVIINYRASPAL